VGSEDRISVIRIAEVVSEEMGLGDVKVMQLEISRIKGLGWRPRMGSEGAVRRFARSRISGVYNIGGGPSNTLSLLELLSMLRDMGLRPEHSFSDWRPADQRVYVSDIRKAERELGWRPRVTPAEGVRRLVDWVLSNRGLFA
jgi:nucleoside-diphosphate-sugar epimerase